MNKSVELKSLHFGFVGLDQSNQLQDHRNIASKAWEIELTTPKVMLETYQVLRIGSSEINTYRDGLYTLDPIPVFMNQMGLFNRTKSPSPNDYITVSQMKEFKQKLDSTPGFLWIVSENNDRVSQINAGRAYVRVQLAATAYGLSMQPLQQALQEYPEQSQTHAQINELIHASSSKLTIQMWGRVGFASPVEPAPRRDLDSLLIL
jgi:hypothetical protein